MNKNKMGNWGRNLAADLFPVRRKWRMWLSYFGPLPIAFGWPYVVEPTVINTLVVLAFYLFVVRSYTKMMIRDQCKADARLQIRAFEDAHAEILVLLDIIPPEDVRPFAELADELEMRTKVLKTMLADLEK